MPSRCGSDGSVVSNGSDGSMAVLSVMAVSGRQAPRIGIRLPPLVPLSDGPMPRQVTGSAPLLPFANGGSRAGAAIGGN